MDSLEIKLFNVIQRLLDSNSGDQRLLFSGVSKEILMRVLQLVQRGSHILKRNNEIVPILLFSQYEDIVKQKTEGYEYNGQEYEELKDAELACKRDQEVCCETGWAFGDGAFCTSVRNKVNNFVILSPLEEPAVIGSIRGAISEVGLSIRPGISLGSFVLKNELFCQLLPSVAGEDIWGKSQFSKLEDIFSVFNDSQIWKLADALNNAATDNQLSTAEFEALLGLPYSKNKKVCGDMLKSQLNVSKILLDAFSDIETFKYFVQRVRDFVDDNPDAEWINQFENDVKTKVTHPQYFADSLFYDYSDLITQNGIANIPQWWKELNVDFLLELEAASGVTEKLQIKLDRSTVLAGDEVKKTQPIVVRQLVAFDFTNKDAFEKIDVLINRKPCSEKVASDGRFEFCATNDLEKQFAMKFVATAKGHEATASYNILNLSTFAPGCYVTLAIPELLKKNTPFKPKGKKGKEFIGTIRAIYPVQNAQFLIFTDPSHELELDSLKYELSDAGIENELKPEVQDENLRYSFISEIAPGGKITFKLKQKQKKFHYTIDLETLDAEPEFSDTAYQDGTKQCLAGKITPGEISYNTGLISSILSHKHMQDIVEDALVGYPVVISNDIDSCFRMASFRQEKSLFTKYKFKHGDPRPSYESWVKSIQSKEGLAYFDARKKLFSKLNQHYGTYVVEQYLLGDLNAPEQFEIRELLSEYLFAYQEWLKSDYDNAIITDTFWGYTTIDEQGVLNEKPDFVFLPPEHPLRLGWQYLAQTMIASMLEQKKFSKMLTSLDASSNPDYFVLPIQLVFDQKIQYLDFFSVKSTSDYWGVLYRFRDEVNQSDACNAPLFSGSWGFEIPSLTKTITKGEITTALTAVKEVCVAKDVLNINLKPKHAFDVCNKAVLDWFQRTMDPNTDKIDALGPRKVNVYASSEGTFPEAEIMSAREMSEGRLFWYTNTNKIKKSSKMDVTIASLSGKAAAPYSMTEAYNGIITAGGLLRYRTRFRGVGSGTEIVESRKANLVEMPMEWLKGSPFAKAFTDVGNLYIGLIQQVEMTERGTTGYLKFSTELKSVLDDENSYYYAFSSSDIDHSCFMPENSPLERKAIYLWDYTLPGVDTHSRNTEGFFLLAPEAQPMLQSVGHAFESICSHSLDETFLRETLFMTAKRGIPTVKKLASGGTNAIGEVGTLIALNALQGNLVNSCKDGLFPVIKEIDKGVYINLLVPMDAFRERFEQLCRETGIKHPCRPDIVAFSIFCLKGEEHTPQTMKVSFIEVKARSGKFSDVQSALDQYSDIYEYFNSIETHPVDQLAKKDFIIAMLMFGFRVYEALQPVIDTQYLKGMYSKVLRKIWQDSQFLQFNTHSRLFIVHKTEKSAASHLNRGVPQVIEMSKDDAYSLIAKSEWPTFFNTLDHWGLLAPIEQRETPLVNPKEPLTGEQPLIATNLDSTFIYSDETSSNHKTTPTETIEEKPYQITPAKDAVITQSVKDAVITQEVEALLKKINDAFEDYKISTTPYQAPIVTPNMILFDFCGNSSCTQRSIEKRVAEFSSTYAVKILHVESRLGYVRISVERSSREVLQIEDVWAKHGYNPETAMNRGVLIALKEENGEPLYLNPAENGALPHTLIAGTTGSGKSVLMQNMLLSLIKNFNPHDVQIILIDPKMVDFQEFSNLPNVKHCTNKDEATELLSQIVDEMDARYATLSEVNAKNISEYRKTDHATKKPMPFIWLFHDEFADWFLDETYKEHVSTAVNRLAIKARAAGIYLVFATQRPDKDVLPMQLRSNLGNKLILKVTDKGTSEIALGDKSLGNAAELLGLGHMIAVLEKFRGYCQVPNVPKDVLAKLTN